jgi:hypothetical protein
MTEPFTPEAVRGILKEVMKGDQRLPTAEGWEVRTLTLILNLMQRNATYRRTRLPAEIERAKNIAKAIWILTEEAPKLRGEYAALLEISESPIPAEIARAAMAFGVDQQDGVETARANLEALDALLAAAQVFRERDLPRLPVGALQPPVERWKGYATDLVETFQQLTGGSVEAGYRFVAATASTITGKEPTVSAVKAAVLRDQVQKKTLAVPGTN